MLLISCEDAHDCLNRSVHHHLAFEVVTPALQAQMLERGLMPPADGTVAA